MHDATKPVAEQRQARNRIAICRRRRHRAFSVLLSSAWRKFGARSDTESVFPGADCTRYLRYHLQSCLQKITHGVSVRRAPEHFSQELRRLVRYVHGGNSRRSRGH
jgi:hypothetical protein